MPRILTLFIPNEQIGFQRGARTSDHVFTLTTLIFKYVHNAKAVKGSKLFACFVDFKAAFDSVWRDALFYKLYRMNIGGVFMSTIRDMYKTVIYHVKLQGGITPGILSKLGVRQGCVMSPLLFKLFIADLPAIFDSSCDPVSLNDKLLSVLMYDDDIVMLSTSEVGLETVSRSSILIVKNGTSRSIPPKPRS